MSAAMQAAAPVIVLVAVTGFSLWCWAEVVRPIRDTFRDARALMAEAPRRMAALEADANRAATAYRACIAASPVPTLECERSGLATYANLAFTSWTGLAASATDGNGWQNALEADVRAEVVAEWRHGMERATGTFEAEVRVADARGRTAPAVMQCAPIGAGWIITFTGRAQQ